jgi:hypothetical protein
VIGSGLLPLTELAGDTAFYGQKQPAIVMTDDSAVERRAVKELWPQCSLLLCSFHVVQAYWRWLTNAANQINSDERQFQFYVFQQLMYAKTVSELNSR